MRYYIYKIINNLNGKAYVGKKSSMYSKDSYLGSGKLIKRAIKKYGKENFTKVVLEIVDEKTFDEKEIFWIEKEGTLHPNGYNLTKGGDGPLGRKMSKFSRQKMSKARTGKETKGSKRVSQFDKNGNFIQTFISAHEAHRKLGVNAAQIGKVCNGNRKFAGGFIWKHAEKGVVVSITDHE
jgi:hypothetical protein